MKISVASGKGGTGKTTIATNLAKMAADRGHAVLYADCDVEEPNGHLFLKPAIDCQESINKLLPTVDLTRCTFCGRCSEVCRYGAIVCVNKQVLIFAELCHSCGGCVLACAANALLEVSKPIGELRFGMSDAVRFVEGRLNIGEAMSPPAIHAVKAAALPADLVILDCPPGTSCPAIEGVRGSDWVLLVTEPTPFGLNDLKLAVKMVRVLKIPMAVVLNRCDLGDNEVRRYCDAQRIPIWAELPDDRAVAEAYSRGQLAYESVPSFAEGLSGMLDHVIDDCMANESRPTNRRPKNTPNRVTGGFIHRANINSSRGVQ